MKDYWIALLWVLLLGAVVFGSMQVGRWARYRNTPVWPRAFIDWVVFCSLLVVIWCVAWECGTRQGRALERADIFQTNMRRLRETGLSK